MNLKKSIPLFWWSSVKFEKKQSENFGDIVGPYLIKKITGVGSRFVQPKKRSLTDYFTKVYFTVGSILQHADSNSIVWGSGLIDALTTIKKAKFLAVRGPRTRQILINQGHDVPEIYGDPALLLPKFYNPKVQPKFSIGIVPHYVDYGLVCEIYKSIPEIKVINLLDNSVESVVNQIISCESIISSSLHGLIVAHAYGKPTIWVKFSEKIFGDGIKFFDYLESVSKYELTVIELNKGLNLSEIKELFSKKGFKIEPKSIENLQKGLIDSCPFINF